MNYDFGELDRRIANIIRIGTVAALDEVNATATVKLDDNLTTTSLPWVTHRSARAGRYPAVHLPGSLSSTGGHKRP
jgi:phage baseplate assembly protein gpV